ncbi:MAG: hypothetical protein AAFX40_03720 [Cyanobacteria bacterium J06639_1]
MCQADTPFQAEVLLSVQRALLAEITPGMRAISVSWSTEAILIRVFHEGQWSEELEDDFDACVVIQVVADFPIPAEGGPTIEYKLIRLDSGAHLPSLGEREAYVYARNNHQWFRDRNENSF